MTVNQRVFASTAPKAAVPIRFLIGWVFLSEGIQKFLFPESLGGGRLAKIGILDPWFTRRSEHAGGITL
jgi:uncharacterized membrane protein YphA (DoxX/SURF4 family)